MTAVAGRLAAQPQPEGKGTKTDPSSSSGGSGGGDDDDGKKNHQKKPPQPQEFSMLHLVARAFVTGYFGGILQALCSHPFDLVKSRIQSGTYPDITTCIKSTLAKEGPTAFYKGVGPPIAIAGIFNAVLFSSNMAAKKFLVYTCDLDPKAPMPITYVMISGIMAAPTSCAVLTPADIVKIQLQLQRESKATAQYRGMVDCILQLYRKDGIHALTRGYVPTLATRVVGLPGFFAGNQAGRGWYEKTFPGSSDVAASLFGGSCAGICFWCSNYPLDLIKTKTQAQKQGAVKVSPLNIAREIFKSGGLRGFYHGFGACMLRALPANASVFAGINEGEKFLRKYGY